jgi:hypothetical protein
MSFDLREHSTDFEGRQPVTRPRIAHLAGPDATIQNTPPLVTSNKARRKHDLRLLRNPDGTVARFDALRPQRLALPVTVYVEQFSAHPLESDAAHLYGPPDGYLDSNGGFHSEWQAPSDKPVYKIELHPDDGLYPLPYMATQANGQAWEEECAFPGAPDECARQPFFPDGSRSFEEIDRLHLSVKGIANLISSKVDVDFYRILPPAGYRRGLAESLRTDVGTGDIAPESRGQDFFPYKPLHLLESPSRRALARTVNMVQRIMASGKYDGAIWTEGSPLIEETVYWLNLLVDTTLPICGNAAQRPQGQIGSDGPKNIVDSVDYLVSRVWADENGRNRAGVVVIQDQRIFAARAVAKVDARSGGFTATGGHGGVLGAAGHDGCPLLHYLPTARHTYASEVNINRLPHVTQGVRRRGDNIETVHVSIKGADGDLLETAIPGVSIVKDGSYSAHEVNADIARQVDLLAVLEDNLANTPLAGFIVEGWNPYGQMTSTARHRLMLRAVHSGMPVVRVGRGNTEGFVPVREPFIGGSNLTATKARLLLMACLIRFGCPPPATDPDHPTSEESAAIRQKLASYQAVFDTH